MNKDVCDLKNERASFKPMTEEEGQNMIGLLTDIQESVKIGNEWTIAYIKYNLLVIKHILNDLLIKDLLASSKFYFFKRKYRSSNSLYRFMFKHRYLKMIKNIRNIHSCILVMEERMKKVNSILNDLQCQK